MGVAISRYAEIADNELVARFCGPEAVSPNDPFWNQMLSFNISPPTTAEEQLMFDAGTEALLQQFLQHNPRTGNLGALVQVMITRATHLLAATTTDNVMLSWQTFNAVFVVRAVCKYLVEVVGEPGLCAHLDAAPPRRCSPQLAKPEGGAGADVSPTRERDRDRERAASPRESRVEMLIDTLISLLIDVPVTDNTYYLHVECLNTLLVLMSVYMFAASHGHTHLIETSLIYRTLFGGRYPLHAPLLVRALLSHVTSLTPAPPDLFGTGSRHQGSLLINIASGLWNMLSLSPAARPSLLSAPAAGRCELEARLRTAHPAATQACLLLLALTHHCMRDNLYRSALLTCQDAASAEPATPPASEAPPPATAPPAPLRVDMQAVHVALCATAGCEHFTLLLYVLLHSCRAYRRHVARDANIDRLVVPVLRVVYSAPESSSHHVYMALIVLLILTEDEALIKNVHTIMLKNPSWYGERTISEISAGGLMVLVVLRALHYNLARVRDKYLHTNCLAAIANMSSEFRNLHPYVAQRLLSLLEILTKRRARLCADVEGDVEGAEPCRAPSAPALCRDNTDEIMEHIAVLDEVIRMLLEILNSCLSRQLAHNLNLVYALLHKRQLFAQHRNQPITQNIDMVIGFFSSRLQRVCEGGDSGEAGREGGGGAQLGPDDVMAVLRKSAALWSSDRLKKFPDLKFRYVEEDRPEEFFTPYVWALLAAAGTLHFASERLPLLNP